MKPTYYSAAWIECGHLITCWHHHGSVGKAAACICKAGGYVIAVSLGRMRSLTLAEEAEFQGVRHSDPGHSPTLETIPPQKEVAVDSRYAVMTRIRVGDRWIWTTWMCFETHADALACAREGNRIVRFESPEWAALRQESEPAAPVLFVPPLQTPPPQSEKETLFEFVLRVMRAYEFDQREQQKSDVTDGSTGPAGNQVPESKRDSELILRGPCQLEDGAFPQLPR